MLPSDAKFLITFIIVCAIPIWIFIVSNSVILSILVPYPLIFPWLIGLYAPLRKFIMGNDTTFTLYLGLSFLPHCVIRRWILYALYYLPNQLSSKCVYVHVKSRRSEIIYKSQLPAKKKDHERWVCISDTHELHRWVDIDNIDCDVLVHTGNFVLHRNDDEGSFVVLKDFNEKIGKMGVELAFCTGGNHDHFLESIGEEKVNEVMDNVLYQVHGFVPVKKFKMFLSAAYEKRMGAATQNSCFRDVIDQKWPKKGSVDILVTHGPVPAVADKLQPKIHIFGHESNSYGIRMRGQILEINCSSVDSFYAPYNLPIVFDYTKAFDDKKKTKA